MLIITLRTTAIWHHPLFKWSQSTEVKYASHCKHQYQDIILTKKRATYDKDIQPDKKMTTYDKDILAMSNGATTKTPTGQWLLLLWRFIFLKMFLSSILMRRKNRVYRYLFPLRMIRARVLIRVHRGKRNLRDTKLHYILPSSSSSS